MYTWLNKWYQMLVFARHLVVPAWRLGMGRLYIWRDTPAWVVQWVAELEPEEFARPPDEFTIRAVLAAREEMELRLKKTLNEVKRAIEAEKQRRGE